MMCNGEIQVTSVTFVATRNFCWRSTSTLNLVSMFTRFLLASPGLRTIAVFLPLRAQQRQHLPWTLLPTYVDTFFFKVIIKNFGRKKRGRSDFQSTLDSKAMGVVAYKLLN